jgi:inward rectifier potassium channel
VQTSATLDYGGLAPNGLIANLLVTVESLAGLLSFGLVSGLMFARFVRPVARVLYSDVAVVAPHRDISAFKLRLINQRTTEISDLAIRVILVRRQKDGEGREYIELELERSKVAFFPLAWTVVHPTEEGSPLLGLTSEALRECEAEFLILLQGFDETFSQVVHSRPSYRAEEVVFGARFVNMFDQAAAEHGDISVDVALLHDVERAALPL